MTKQRAKIAATATVLGLGALGGVALGTNHGLPATTAQVGGTGSKSVATASSGSTAAVSRPAVVNNGVSTRPPIVTRASGIGAAGLAPVDD